MIESIIAGFIIYFVVIAPIGSAPIFLAVTNSEDRYRKIYTPLEGTIVATMIILFLLALVMLAAKRQARKRAQSGGDSPADEIDSDNLAIYPLTILLLAGPAAIMSAIVSMQVLPAASSA